MVIDTTVGGELRDKIFVSLRQLVSMVFLADHDELVF